MKFTILSGARQGAVRRSTQKAEAFFERITEDHNDWLISSFRQALPRLSKPELFLRYHKIAHVLPAVELSRQENGALQMTQYNGIIVLEVKPLRSKELVQKAKRQASTLPSTLAAFTGADGQSVDVLVRVKRTDGTLPKEEADAARFYDEAFAQVLPLYQSALQDLPLETESGGLRHALLLPLDQEPYVDMDAAAIKIQAVAEAPTSTDAFAALPAPRHRQKEEDWEAYSVYENLFGMACRRAHESTGIAETDALNPLLLTAIAHEMLEAGVPQEETVTHLWHHLMFKDDADEQAVRSIVEATYDDELADGFEAPKTLKLPGQEMRELIRRLEQRYVFRRNEIMGWTEYRRNASAHSLWAPIDRSAVSDFVIELRVAGVNISEKDVWNYVLSRRRIPRYNPVTDYLYDCRDKWDGKDHIRALARTVPTEYQQWPDLFHTWFLSMVAQWRGMNRRFGNALVPLLVSRQGYHKSDFCRQLLPRQLRSWGFTDSLLMEEKKTVLTGMTQLLLINLDEFNQISPRQQEGFLKNIIQLPVVKLKRPHAKHIEDVPRLASFIATTNQADVLSDPAGSRRFIGVHVTGDINTTQQPNYEQLYAQAMQELDNDVRYWLDADETTLLMEHNRQFQQYSAALNYFFDYFEVTDDATSPDSIWLSASAILAEVKHRAGGAMKVPTLNKFARELRQLPDIHSRSTRAAVEYLVKRK